MIIFRNTLGSGSSKCSMKGLPVKLVTVFPNWLLEKMAVGMMEQSSLLSSSPTDLLSSSVFSMGVTRLGPLVLRSLELNLLFWPIYDRNNLWKEVSIWLKVSDVSFHHGGGVGWVKANHLMVNQKVERRLFSNFCVFFLFLFIRSGYLAHRMASSTFRTSVLPYPTLSEYTLTDIPRVYVDTPRVPHWRFLIKSRLIIIQIYNINLPGLL